MKKIALQLKFNASYGSKDAEYKRTLELFNEIFETKGVYFALAFLYDSQYDRNDIAKIMKLLEPEVREQLKAQKS